VNSETYLTADRAPAELAQTMLDTGQVYLLNAAALHPFGLELEVLLDEHDIARGLRITRVPAGNPAYGEAQHIEGLARLGAHGRLDRVWRAIHEEARRISMFLFGGR